MLKRAVKNKLYFPRSAVVTWTKLGLKEDLIQRKCAFRIHMFSLNENSPAVFIVRVVDD